MQNSPGTPYSDRQVGKAVDRNLFRDDPHWARPYLRELVQMRLLVSDSTGFYYQAPVEKKVEMRRFGTS